MKHTTNCKFCKDPITIEIDDGYAELGDPLKLIRLAACNRCADFRVARSKYHDFFANICIEIANARRDNSPRLAHLHTIVTDASRRYAQAVCAFLRSRTLHWNEDLGTAIFNSPDKWPKLLADYRRVTFNAIRNQLYPE